MSLRDEYQKVTDKFGFITPDGSVCYNGIRFTTEYLFVLKKANLLTQEDIDKYTGLFNSCEKEPGLLCRSPDDRLEQEGPDDLFANIAADSVLNHGFAKRFLQYGQQKCIEFDNETQWGKRKINQTWGKVIFFFLKLFGLNLYVYNNVAPGKFNLSAWIGRQPAIIAHAKLIAKERLGIFWTFFWCLGVVLSARNKDSQDGKVLTWFCVKASEGKRNLFMSLVVKYWIKKLKEHYPHGIGEVLAKYFNNPSHPSAIYLQDEFGE